jgi:hypothetical protein
MRNLTKTVQILALVFLQAALAIAQITTAAISGVVQDSSEQVVPGATVTVKHLETGATRTIMTDASGRYLVVRFIRVAIYKNRGMLP